MNAKEYLNSLGITKLTCYTDGAETYYFNDLVRIMDGYVDSKVKNPNEAIVRQPTHTDGCICVDCLLGREPIYE